MTTNVYADNLWKELESAWDLCVVANSYPINIRSDGQKIWDDLFSKSPVVEHNKPCSALFDSRLEVFCKNKYGLYYNEKINSWVPFRHGDIDLKKI
jgi:hypothetical protein